MLLAFARGRFPVLSHVARRRAAAFRTTTSVAALIATLTALPASAQQQVTLTNGQNIAGPVDLGTAGIAYALPGLATDRATISGQIGGSGPLIKDGIGTLVLQNALSDYTGDTIVRAGTLEGRLSRFSDLTVMSGATYRVIGSQMLQSLSGSGSVVGGVGTTLSVNLSAVPLQVFSGWLSVDQMGLGGSGTFVFRGEGGESTRFIVGNATLQVESRVGEVRAGSPGGTLRLGDGAVAGRIFIRGESPFTIDVPNGVGQVEFVNAAVEGETQGTLIKTGAGTLRVPLDDPDYGGPGWSFNSTVIVREGRLAVDGTVFPASFAGSRRFGEWLVEGAGTLGGTGQIGYPEDPETGTRRGEIHVFVNDGGTIAPGNSIGTLTIVGPVVFNAGSSLAVEVDAQGRTDLLRIDGTATINGGAVRVLPLAGTYNPETRYVILTSTGTVAGRFTGVTVARDFAFLTPTLAYAPNEVALVLVRNGRPIDPTDPTDPRDPNDPPGNPDQDDPTDPDDPGGEGEPPPSTECRCDGRTRTVGGVLDTMPTTHPVVRAVLSLDRQSVRPALNALSGELYPGIATAWLDEGRLVREAVLSRLRQSSARSGIPAFVSAQGGPAVDGFASGFALWGQAFGSFGGVKGDHYTASLDRSSRGFVFGADYGQGPWRVGLVAGYTQTSLDQPAHSASANLDTYYAGGYGGFSFNGFNLKVGGLYTVHDIETNRSVAFSDFRDRLGANVDAKGWQLFGEIGYTFQLGQVSLQPFAGLTYVHVESDGFLEEGGPAALMSRGMSRSFGYSTLGLRASTEVAVGSTALGLHGMIGWRHAFAEDNSFATLAFRDWCLPFKVAGVPVAQDSLVIEAGLDWKIGPQAKLGVSYSGVLAQDAQDHAFKADLTIRF